jgi:hypothetical protein
VNANSNLVADVTLLPPKGTSAEQLAQLSLLPPAELLLSSSSLRKDLITAERSNGQVRVCSTHSVGVGVWSGEAGGGGL